MKRRLASSGPAKLTVFEVDAWADPADKPGFERYSAALTRWADARDTWADEHGFDGDLAWWDASHRAIAAMPDEPWDPEAI